MAEFWKEALPPSWLFLQPTWLLKFRTEPWQASCMQTPTEKFCLAQSSANIPHTYPRCLPSPLYSLAPPLVFPLALFHCIPSLLTGGKAPKPRAPWPVLHIVLCCLFLSAPLPDTCWFFKPVLSCQSSTWPPEGSLQPFKFKESKTIKDEKKSLRYLKQVLFGKSQLVGEGCMCKVRSLTVLERALQSQCISYIRNLCSFVMN